MNNGSGIVMIIFLVIAGLILFLMIGVPWLANRPLYAPIDSCINNLRCIDGATIQWAMEHHRETNAAPTWADIQPYLKFTLQCQAGGRYTLARLVARQPAHCRSTCSPETDLSFGL